MLKLCEVIDVLELEDGSTDKCINFTLPRAIVIGYTDLVSFVAVGRSKKKFRGFCPQANYVDRATAACWLSSANFCG
jgi:hypothetical protein